LDEISICDIIVEKRLSVWFVVYVSVTDVFFMFTVYLYYTKLMSTGEEKWSSLSDISFT